MDNITCKRECSDKSSMLITKMLNDCKDERNKLNTKTCITFYDKNKEYLFNYCAKICSKIEEKEKHK